MRSKIEYFTDKSRCVGRISEENYTLDQRNFQRLILLFVYRRQKMYENLQFWLLHLSKVSFTRAQLYILHASMYVRSWRNLAKIILKSFSFCPKHLSYR